jgi:hypothetical protein
VSIDQLDVVDAVGVESASGKLILSIADHLSWEEEEEHLLALKNKLNAYLAYIESGQLFEAYPDSRGRVVLIDVVAKFSPSAAAETFLRQAAVTLREAGYELRFRTLPAPN